MSVEPTYSRVWSYNLPSMELTGSDLKRVYTQIGQTLSESDSPLKVFADIRESIESLASNPKIEIARTGETTDSLIVKASRTYRGFNDSDLESLSVIASNIVDKHLGKIWAESEVGQGTTFYVKLPVNLAKGS